MFPRALSLSRRSGIVRSINQSKSSIKAIHSVPINVNLEDAKDIPLCINCKYFLPDKLSKSTLSARCKKHGEVSVIDGVITYTLVTHARQYHCHGNDFEAIDLKDIDPDSHKALFK